MPVGNVQFSSTGQVLFTSGGVMMDPDCCQICTPCDRCTDATPETYWVTFAGTTVITGCRAFGGGVSYHGGGANNFNGTHLLTRNAFYGPAATGSLAGLCCWVGSFTGPVITTYSDQVAFTEDCSVAPLEASTTWHIKLCKQYDAITNTYSWSIEVYVEGYKTPGFAFFDGPATGDGNCAALSVPVFTNQQPAPPGAGAITDAMGGGTATISA